MMASLPQLRSAALLVLLASLGALAPTAAADPPDLTEGTAAAVAPYDDAPRSALDTGRALQDAAGSASQRIAVAREVVVALMRHQQAWTSDHWIQTRSGLADEEWSDALRLRARKDLLVDERREASARVESLRHARDHARRLGLARQMAPTLLSPTFLASLPDWLVGLAAARHLALSEAALTVAEREVEELQALIQGIDARVALVEAQRAASAREHERTRAEEGQLRREAARTDEAQARAEEVRRRAEEARRAERDAERRELANSLQGVADALQALVEERRQTEADMERQRVARADQALALESLVERLHSIRSMAAQDEARRERAMRLYRDVAELRPALRGDLHAIRSELPERESYLSQRTQEVLQAESALLLALDERAGRPDTSLEAVRAEVREAALDLAQRQRDLAELRVSLLRSKLDDHASALRTLLWTADRAMMLLERSQRREVQRLSSALVHEMRENIQDRAYLRQRELEAALRAALAAPRALLTLDGFLVGSGVLWRLCVALILWGLVRRWRDPATRTLLEYADSSLAFRRWRGLMAKLIELLHTSSSPLALYAGYRLLSHVWAGDNDWIRASHQVAWLLLWWSLLQRWALCLFIPAAQRPQRIVLPDQNAERGRFDLFPMEETQARLAVTTVQWLIGYQVAAQLLLVILTLGVGQTYLRFLVADLLFWGMVVLAYGLSWVWRRQIVTSFLRLANLERSRWGDLLTRHQDRPYSVLVLLLLMLYVIAHGFWRWLRSRTKRASLSKRAQNFLFRKRIELAQGQQGAKLAVVAPEALFTPDERRALAEDPIAAPDLWVERTTLVPRLGGWPAQWASPDAVGQVRALVGEQGSGRTTLLRWLGRQPQGIDPPTLVSLAEAPPRSPDALLQRLAQVFDVPHDTASGDPVGLTERILAGPRRVVFVDDAHALFLRTIGGFDTLDVLLELTSATRARVDWILTFNLFAWRYIHRARDRRHFFGEVVTLPPFTDDELQAMLERRVGYAGLDLDFQHLVAEEAESPSSDDHAADLARGAFRLLNEYAEGNPAVALHYWQRCFVGRRDNALQVALFSPPPLPWLRELKDAHLFALTALAQHEALTLDELARIVASEHGLVYQDLTMLVEAGAVFRRGERYVLHPGAMRPVIHRLRDANLLTLRK